MRRTVVPALVFVGVLTTTAPVAAYVVDPRAAKTAALLQCDGPAYSGGILEGSEGGGATPEEALSTFARGPVRPLPRYGYDVLERSATSVLFAYRNAARVRAAVRVEKRPTAHDGSQSRDAWSFTSYAGCDPAEFAPSADDEIGMDLVRLPDGTRLPARTAQVRWTQPHCEPGVTALVFGLVADAYVRDPEGSITPELVVPYNGDATLPTAAVDTGLRTGEYALFRDTDARALYAVAADRVERWPARLPQGPRACG